MPLFLRRAFMCSPIIANQYSHILQTIRRVVKNHDDSRKKDGCLPMPELLGFGMRPIGEYKRRVNMKKIVFVILVVIMLAGCAVQTAPDVPDKTPDVQPLGVKATLIKQPVDALDSDFVRGVNGFGFSAASLLFDDGNVALSPASIELALCMTRAGAAGQTKADMAAVLGLSGLTDAQVSDACRSLMWRANTGGMEAADAIWVGEGLTLSDAFAKTCAEDFMADAYALKIPGAMDAINAWAGEKTHGRIDDIIQEELDPSVRMVLANALYFLGDWTEPFEANETYDEAFHASSGDVTTSFMHSTRAVPYYEGENFSMITLDFESEAGEGQYAMAVLLPGEGSSVDELLGSLTGETFADALAGAQARETIIGLPKFEFSYFTSLRELLIDMGMGVAFGVGGDADVSAMTAEPNGLYIDEVLHKCFVKVDELGAEAAAVTVVEMRETGAMPPENAAEFHADRPFVFAIYSREDGTVAFMGAVNDPSQE
jgi:serpin B